MTQEQEIQMYEEWLMSEEAKELFNAYIKCGWHAE